MINYTHDYLPWKNVPHIAAAIIGGAVVSAGATAFASSKAADTQRDAANASIGAQREMFGITREELDPFISAGQDVLPTLQGYTDPNAEGTPLNALLKLVMPGASMTDTLRQTPGYQFKEEMGLKAVENALARRGLGGAPGAVARGAGEYVTGLADSTWLNQVDALLKTFGLSADKLQNIVNTGSSAAAALGGNATQVGGNIGSTLTGLGNAQAGATMNIGNAVGGVGNSVSQAALFDRLLGGGSGGGLYANPATVWGNSDLSGPIWLGG